MLSETSGIIKGIAEKYGLSTQNIHLQTANVLDRKQLEKAIHYFDGKRFGVCNEGLLMYLGREEQAQMAQNIREMLLTSGGSWVTPDIDNLKEMEERIASYNSEIRKVAEAVFMGISNKTGRDIREGYFPTEKEALKFYGDLGFSVEPFPFYTGYNLSTSDRVTEDMKPQVMKSLSTRNAWILKPKK